MAQRRVPEKGGRYAPIGMISPPSEAPASPPAPFIYGRGSSILFDWGGMGRAPALLLPTIDCTRCRLFRWQCAGSPLRPSVSHYLVLDTDLTRFLLCPVVSTIAVPCPAASPIRGTTSTVST